MRWYRVEIQSNDVAAISAQNLMLEFAKAYRAAELPVDALVYHIASTGGDHLYYFFADGGSHCEKRPS